MRVVVADDQPLVRDAIRAVLERHDDTELAGTATDGRRAITTTFECRPDVVLMDVRMPGMTGVEATRRILADWPYADIPRPRVLMLTTFDLDEYVHAALRAGAAGYILKDSSIDRLADAIAVIADGQAMLAPSVTQRLIRAVNALPPTLLADHPAPPAGRLNALTDREREVARLAARGLTNRQIARDLALSESSVKSALNRVLTRLGLRNRVQIALVIHDLDGRPDP
ncbi:response regulator transcription factor [Actinomadura graeca]|uniref:Response regulator transcription factor n=1 Tax=Actinomadura graeca TaxID=2750812 RepID=A0ABX8R775_9ACTN|nr:response regulator transcription factor [Actinomadura graeca]